MIPPSGSGGNTNDDDDCGGDDGDDDDDDDDPSAMVGEAAGIAVGNSRSMSSRTSPSQRITARSTTFDSSRMLPGQR